MEPHRVLEVEALPFVHSLAQSELPADRATFVRLYRDLAVMLQRRGEAVPAGWAADLQLCLDRAAPSEREIYSTELARSLRAAPSSVAQEEIEAILAQGDDMRLLALAGERRARLRPEHIAALALRARKLADAGDLGLAAAVLAREPVRLEAAPLFLEASPAQRRTIMLAAQRAELGRNAGLGPTLDERVAVRLEFAAIAGGAGEFAEALADALGASSELSRRIAADPDGEPLAVALAALGAPYDLSVRIMAACDLSEEGDGFARIHTLALLGDRLSAPAARRIVAAMIGRATAAAPALEPPAPARQAAEPSPFLRREGLSRRVAVSPETPKPLARNSRTP